MWHYAPRKLSSGCRLHLANGEKGTQKFDGKLGQYLESNPIARTAMAREQNVKILLILTALTLIGSPANGADLESGKALAATVCSACHGANGVSVGSRIPHLAGQRTAYLTSQLEAFKVGTRKNALMAVIAPN
jgi:cytochrome c553